MMTCVYSPRKNMHDPQAAVFGVIAADELLLALRQVERQPVRLGQRADVKNQARQRLVPEFQLPEAARRLLRRESFSRFSVPVSSTTPRTDMPSGIS